MLEHLVKIPKEPQQLVYIVGFRDYVKIGYTSDFWSRFSALQSSAPEKLIIYGAIFDASKYVERKLHETFALYRLEGEWFRKTRDLNRWIKNGCDEYGRTRVVVKNVPVQPPELSAGTHGFTHT